MQVILLTTSIAAIAVAAALAYFGNNTGASIVAAASGLFLIFTFLSRFKRFKGFGVEAELWEEKMEEADRLIEQMKKLSVTLSKPVVTYVAYAGLLVDNISPEQRHQWVSDIVKLLKANGVSDAEIEGVLVSYHKRNVIEITRPIVQFINKKLNTIARDIDSKMQALGRITDEKKQLQNELMKKSGEIHKYRNSLSEVYKIDFCGSAAKTFEDLLKQIKIDYPDVVGDYELELSTSLDQLKHYELEKKFKNESWLKSDELPKA
ncbi:MAG: hypothetical protein WD044_13545 [Dongiaceae bacterium]